MNKEFATYEQALALKELGFDEPCFGYWKSKNWIIQEKTRTDGYAHADQECSAPTYSQAFRWFREKYDLPSHIAIYWQYDWNNYSYEWNIVENHEQWNVIEHFKTYEEAEHACLDKLIQIVK